MLHPISPGCKYWLYKHSFIQSVILSISPSLARALLLTGAGCFKCWCYFYILCSGLYCILKHT